MSNTPHHHARLTKPPAQLMHTPRAMAVLLRLRDALDAADTVRPPPALCLDWPLRVGLLLVMWARPMS